MRNPSMRQAEWIYANMAQFEGCSGDDVYDVLLGNISSPRDFVDEVHYWSLQYEDDQRRHTNAR